MKTAYVAGPYRADTVRGIIENIRRAEEVALELWKLGFAVITPHKNSALFDGAADDSVWLAGSLELMRRSDLIEPTTLPGGIVLDPFMVSGTTLEGAATLGRKSIGIEAEERYCEIAARRLAQEVLPLEMS